MTADYKEAVKTAESYYDSADADAFYNLIWGGEDIHVGLYEGPKDDIKQASARTVAHMAAALKTLKPGKTVLDIGAGYGGAGRHLAREHGAVVTCLNLSEKENARNRALNEQQGLDDMVTVEHGSFEDIPHPDASFDILWSQDAILHSGDRERVLSEAVRVLKPGGEFIFTDPMQADEIRDPAALQPIYDRIHLPNLGSFRFYRETLARLGLEEVGVEDLTHQLRNHYARVREELQERRAQVGEHISEAYIDRMLKGLKHWVDGADAGLLAWGVIHFRKP